MATTYTVIRAHHSGYHGAAQYDVKTSDNRFYVVTVYDGLRGRVIHSDYHVARDTGDTTFEGTPRLASFRFLNREGATARKLDAAIEAHNSAPAAPHEAPTLSDAETELAADIAVIAANFETTPIAEMESAMKTYTIANRVSGFEIGEYQGSTKAEALDVMARDAGYRDFSQACDVTGNDGDDLIVTEVVGD